MILLKQTNQTTGNTIMKTLKLSTGSFDQVNTFQIDIGKAFHMKASLNCGYDKQDDGIFWALKSSACIKDVYTEADYTETARFDSEEPLKHGEIVIIEGEQYRVRVKGQFSDCAMFDKV